MSDIASYKELILADAPLIYLPLDATDGLTDLSGNGRNGTVVGAGVSVGTQSGPGDALTATDFSGAAGNYITTAYSPFANGGTLTFEAWVNRDATTDEDVIFGSAGTPNDFRFGFGGGSMSLFFNPAMSGGNVSWSPSGVVVATWYHMMLVFNEATDTATLYWNGVSQGARTQVVAYTTPGNLWIGARSGGGPLDGKIAHPAVYNGDLSARALDHWSWGISTAASRNPLFGLPSPSNFPHPSNLPRGEGLGQP